MKKILENKKLLITLLVGAVVVGGVIWYLKKPSKTADKTAQDSINTSGNTPARTVRESSKIIGDVPVQVQNISLRRSKKQALVQVQPEPKKVPRPLTLGQQLKMNKLKSFANNISMLQARKAAVPSLAGNYQKKSRIESEIEVLKQRLAAEGYQYYRGNDGLGQIKKAA